MLFQDYVPDLFAHFYDLGVETHMYASQWFLTLFTAKFPLQMVYFIVDLFLSEVMDSLFLCCFQFFLSLFKFVMASINE